MRRTPEARCGISVHCDRIAAVIDLLISYHPKGFKILMGEAPTPTPLEIHEMMNATRFPMPDDFKPTTRSSETQAERIVHDTEYFEKTISVAGGWPHLTKTVHDFRESTPRVWAVVVDYEKFVSFQIERCGSKLGFVAKKHGVGVNTVLRYRRNFPVKIAQMCLLPDT